MLLWVRLSGGLIMLLECCIRAAGCQGGTIWQFLPRLSWVLARGPSVRGMEGHGPIWSLMFDGVKEIGWAAREIPPEITPALSICFWRD